MNHVRELPALWGDSDVIRYTATPDPHLLEQTCSRADSLFAFDVSVIRMEDEAMGVVGCIRMDGPGERYGAFYQLKKILWGKGFATHTAE